MLSLGSVFRLSFFSHCFAFRNLVCKGKLNIRIFVLYKKPLSCQGYCLRISKNVFLCHFYTKLQFRFQSFIYSLVVNLDEQESSKRKQDQDQTRPSPKRVKNIKTDLQLLSDELAKRIVGHDETKRKVITLFERYYANLHCGILCLEGPDGIGKKFVFREIADIFKFNLHEIDCNTIEEINFDMKTEILILKDLDKLNQDLLDALPELMTNKNLKLVFATATSLDELEIPSIDVVETAGYTKDQKKNIMQISVLPKFEDTLIIEKNICEHILEVDIDCGMNSIWATLNDIKEAVEVKFSQGKCNLPYRVEIQDLKKTEEQIDESNFLPFLLNIILFGFIFLYCSNCCRQIIWCVRKLN